VPALTVSRSIHPVTADGEGSIAVKLIAAVPRKIEGLGIGVPSAGAVQAKIKFMCLSDSDLLIGEGGFPAVLQSFCTTVAAFLRVVTATQY
jgi:hypothetical protein